MTILWNRKAETLVDLQNGPSLRYAPFGRFVLGFQIDHAGQRSSKSFQGYRMPALCSVSRIKRNFWRKQTIRNK